MLHMRTRIPGLGQLVSLGLVRLLVATAPAAKKTKRVISPEAKARMIAGAKKRWAKVNAAKKAA